MRRVLAGAVAFALLGCGDGQTGQPSATAPQENKQAQQPMAHGHAPGRDLGPAARALDESMQRMHAQMGVASADPDESFMRMMIPHHRGAIDMARIELEHGKDPQARRLAEQIIASQSREIAEIEAWLAQHKSN